MPPEGIVVLGMHRSGTSSVTRVLNLLGARLGADGDLVSGADNPDGHWESTTLVHVNDGILAAAGGDWCLTPRLDPGWESSPWADALLPDLATAFTETYPPGDAPWLWKDPRTCLTMPLWRRVLSAPATVLVLRDPRPVAQSLQRRNGLRIGYGVALWERYTRAAVAGSTGLPTVAVRFEELVADPSAGVAALRDHLRQLGLTLDGDPAAAAASVHDTTPSQAATKRLSGRRGRFLQALDAVPAVSAAFAPPELPAPSYLSRRFGSTSLARPYGISGRHTRRRRARTP